MEGLKGERSSGGGSGKDGNLLVLLTKTLDVLNWVREKLLEESDSNDEADVLVLMKADELVDDLKSLKWRIPGYKQEIKDLRTENARMEIKIHQLTTKIALPTGQNKNFKGVEALKSQGNQGEGEATTSGIVKIEQESSVGTRSDELSSPHLQDHRTDPIVPKALGSIDSLPMQQSTQSNEKAATSAAGETSSSSSGTEGVRQPTIVKLIESGLPRGGRSSNFAVVDKNSRMEETDGQTSTENKDKENSENEVEYDVEKLLKKRIVNGSVCYVCGSYSEKLNFNSKEEGEGEGENRECLKLFCEQLKGVSEGFSGFQERFVPASLIALLDSSICQERLSMCEFCQHLIRRVVNERKMMMELEENVVELQKELLNKLTALKNKTEQFSKEMGKVEEVVKKSDKSCLNSFIDNEGGNCQDWMKRDIGLFRIRILKVSSELNSHQNRLKVITLSKSQSKELPKSVKRKFEEDSSQNPVEGIKENISGYRSMSVVSASQIAAVPMAPPQVEVGVQEETEAVYCSAVKQEVDKEDLNVEDNQDLSEFEREEEEIEYKHEDKHEDYSISPTKRRQHIKSTQLTQNSSRNEDNSPNSLEFIETATGRKCIAFEDHIFYDSCKYTKYYVTFECSYRRSTGCKSKIFLYGYRKEEGDSYSRWILSGSHGDHPQVAERIQKLKEKNKMGPLKKNWEEKKVTEDNELELIPTLQDRSCLTVNGYIFYVDSRTVKKGDFICKKMKRGGCKCSIRIENFREEGWGKYKMDSYLQSGQHNHPPEPETVEKMKCRINFVSGLRTT